MWGEWSNAPHIPNLGAKWRWMLFHSPAVSQKPLGEMEDGTKITGLGGEKSFLL
jgi:hypothetical protein